MWEKNTLQSDSGSEGENEKSEKVLIVPKLPVSEVSSSAPSQIPMQSVVWEYFSPCRCRQ